MTELPTKMKTYLTVKQLREQLEDLPDDSPVMFAYQYGDYWRSRVAQPVRFLDEDTLVWSSNLAMWRTLKEDEDIGKHECTLKATVIE